MHALCILVFSLSLLTQSPVESIHYPAPTAWADVGVWPPDHQCQLHRVCLALHHIQLCSGQSDIHTNNNGIGA